MNLSDIVFDGFIVGLVGFGIALVTASIMGDQGSDAEWDRASFVTKFFFMLGFVAFIVGAATFLLGLVIAGALALQ